MPRRLIVPGLIAHIALAGMSMDARLQAGESLLPDGAPIAFSGDLGAKRVNWTQSAWKTVALPQPRDLSAADGLTIAVATDQPRQEVEAYIALMESDGSWLYHPRACPLSAATNAGTVRFADFIPAEWCAPANPDGKGGSHADENGRLDTTAIVALAVGTVNPFGVGKVAFTVTGVDPRMVEVKAEPTTRIVVSGRLLDVNATTTVPAGLFGGFHVPKTTHERYRLAMSREIGGIGGRPRLGSGVTHMHVITHGDRGGTSPVLHDANWRTGLPAAATAAGLAAKAAGKRIYVEFWNEPYLNWANKNRISFHPDRFDQAKAAEGATVLLKDGSACPHLFWTRDYDAPPWNWATPRFTADGRDHWRRGVDAKGRMWSTLFMPTGWNRKNSPYNPDFHPPKDVKDGEKYTVTAKDKAGKETTTELTAMTPWWIYDKTQFTFWSASGLGRFYNEPMAAVGKALKAADPTATYIVGWASRPTEDHYAAWDLVYRDTIDAIGADADGVNDHDYGGDPLRLNASAEVVAAYGVTRHRKLLHSYNTECSPSADPEAYAGGGTPDPLAANRVKYRWALRKLISAIAQQPDKMRSFAFFGDGERPSKSYFSPAGEGIAFDLLMTLRGRLVHAISPTTGIHVAAAIDGADPINPRPATLPQRNELVVAVLNDHVTAENVTVEVTAPSGTTFASVGIRRGTTEADVPTVLETPGDLAAGATAWTFTGPVPPRDAVVLAFPLSGTPGTAAETLRRSAFSPLIAVRVLPAKPAESTIAADPDTVALAARPGARAWLRLAVENVAAGEATLTFKGLDLPIPAVVLGDNGSMLTEIPIDPATIKADNRVAVRITDVKRTAGFILGAVSVMVEGPAK